jgi:hypothetical protein
MGSIDDEHSCIAGGGEELGENDFILRQGSPIGVGEGESAGEEVPAVGDGGERGCVMLHKYDGFLGELIKVGGLGFEGAIAIEREVVSSECIGDDDYKVQILHKQSLLLLSFKILQLLTFRGQVFLGLKRI